MQQKTVLIAAIAMAISALALACTPPDYTAKPDPRPSEALVVPEIDAVRLTIDDEYEAYRMIGILAVCLTAGDEPVACADRILDIDPGTFMPDQTASQAPLLLGPDGPDGGYPMSDGFVEVGMEEPPEGSPSPDALTLYCGRDSVPPFNVSVAIRVEGHWYSICDFTEDAVLANTDEGPRPRVRCALPKMTHPKSQGVTDVPPPPSLIAFSARDSCWRC
jgi:hypothetical protein